MSPEKLARGIALAAEVSPAAVALVRDLAALDDAEDALDARLRALPSPPSVAEARALLVASAGLSARLALIKARAAGLGLLDSDDGGPR